MTISPRFLPNEMKYQEVGTMINSMPKTLKWIGHQPSIIAMHGAWCPELAANSLLLNKTNLDEYGTRTHDR